MKQHKWHKEIKAWADGAEIESRFLNDDRDWGEWDRNYGQCPNWDCTTSEHRIKPQPKEPTKFLGFKEIPYKHWVLRFYKMPNDLWYTEGINDEWMNEMVEASKPEPKEPQYLYVFEINEGNIYLAKDEPSARINGDYIGKIKLEVDDDTYPA